jgi:hypothetical protein
MYKPDGEGEKKHWLYSPKISGAIAAAMLIVFLLLSFTIDIAKPGVIEKTFEESSAEIDFNALLEKQKLLKTISQQRPDLLKLLNQITESGQNNQNDQRGRGRSMMMGSGGIQLDSFHFKRGQKITITGQASDNEELYAFQDNLLSNPDISEVVPTVSQNNRSTTNTRSGTTTTNNRNTRSVATNRGGMNRGGSRGSGGINGGLKFNITFNYKKFTTTNTKK